MNCRVNIEKVGQVDQEANLFIFRMTQWWLGWVQALLVRWVTESCKRIG